MSTLSVTQFPGHEPLKIIYANTIERHFKTYPHQLEKQRQHNFHIFLFFTHGTGFHHIVHKSYDVKPNSLFLLLPGQLHSWELSADADGYILFYTKELQVATLKLRNSRPCIYPENEVAVRLGNLLQILLREYENGFSGKQAYIETLSTQLNIEVERMRNINHLIDVNILSIYQKKLKKFEQLLEENFKKEKRPHIYAAQLHISLKHLNRILLTLTGKTTTATILTRVMLEAQRLLINSNGTHATVAYALGYEDYAHFCHAFKRNMGKSPTAFLENL